MSGLAGSNASRSGIVGGKYSAGEVVQKKHMVSNTKQSTTHSSNDTWTEPNNGYRVAITPKFANSRIEVEYYIPFNQHSAANILTLFKFFRIITGGSRDYDLTSKGSGAGGARHQIAGSSFRPVGFDAQDSDFYSGMAQDFPNTNLEVFYGFSTKPQGTNTTTWGYSVGTSSDWGWDAAIMITATEIKV